MKKVVIASLLIVWLCFDQAHAQINVSASLKDAIDAAINKSATIKNEKLNQEKAYNERKAVLNKYLPSVSALAAYGYVNNDLKLDIPTVTLPGTGVSLFEESTKVGNEGNIFLTGLLAKQVIFSGGQIVNGAKALESKNKGEEYMAELKKDDVIKEVINAFDQISLLAQARALINESEIRLRKETERVERAIAQGLAVPYDRDKLKLASLNLESKKAEIDGKQTLLYAKINTLTGYDEAQTNAVAYELMPITINDNLDINKRNELKAFSAYAKALDYNLKKEKGSLLPTVGAFASYSYGSLFNANSTIPLPVSTNPTAVLNLNQATLYPNLIVGGILKWDLFNGFERKHKIDAVKIDQQMLSNKREDAELMMNLQLKNSLVNYKTQMDQLAIADQKEKIVNNNLVTVEKQYRLGLINVTERISAETERYEILLEKTQTVINQRQAALDAYAAAATLDHFIQVK